MQIDFSRPAKADTFLFQSQPLFMKTGGRAEADFTASVDDPMPGDIVGARAHGPADGTGATRHPERPRDLSVRDDLTPRHTTNQRVNAGE
jgi:hypothetical protein